MWTFSFGPIILINSMLIHSVIVSLDSDSDSRSDM
jgi:hypothetical protein